MIAKTFSQQIMSIKCNFMFCIHKYWYPWLLYDIHVIGKYQPCHFLSISGKVWTHLGPQRWNGLVDFILQHSQFWRCLWNYKYRKNKRYKGRILVVRYMYWIYPHQVYKIELQVSSFIANMNYWYRRAIIKMQCSKRFVYIEMINHFQR